MEVPEPRIEPEQPQLCQCHKVDPLTHCASAAIQAAAVGFLTYCVTVETLTLV